MWELPYFWGFFKGFGTGSQFYLHLIYKFIKNKLRPQTSSLKNKS
ncbi:hypothetical protein G436_4021 [Leptospira interrogans serovar Hardjo str. Norma]|uniref:Uncharacterized protein n=1 Tax=Leptospira interrogans serovar Hardjo str. Norma TaxID=1279460 RepID=A0A0M4NN42_LEPIR|nr:hypothetical protein G436_4021 [Leptospira interrogans serovar Hardjo str. Norma]